MKVLIDIGGCDSPDKMIAGAVNAAKAHPDYTVVLVGAAELIKSNLKENLSNIEIEDAPDVITNDDSPTHGIRQKPDSSLARAISLLTSSDEYVGVVSGGSTGAVLTGATLYVGRLSKDVQRPVLAGLMPTAIDGKLVCIADSGANVDCKPEFLAQFAVMASIYMQTACGVENPKVALLSVGTEDKKGDERTREAYKLIRDLPINFVGNMEARDALSGKYDVVVCDGFSGNVLIKATEGTAKMVVGKLKEAIMSSFSAKIGALFMKKALKNMKSSMDYHKYGGAAFLGVKKIVVKAHGSANERSTQASIDRVISLHENNVLEKIKAGISATLGNSDAKSEEM